MADAIFAARMRISLDEAATADYLGDGVYAWADGYHVWLGTLEGDRIALEPNLFSKLNNFRDRMIAGQKCPKNKLKETPLLLGQEQRY